MHADLEARLWHIVSEHADLADCLPRLHAELRRVSASNSIVLRRLEETPLRLVTVAAAGSDRSFDVDGQIGSKSELTREASELVRGLVSRRRVECVSTLAPQLTHQLLGCPMVDDVWAIPLAADEMYLGLAFLSLPRTDSASTVELLTGVRNVLDVAFKNDHAHQEAVRTREALRADKEALLSRLGRHDINEVIVGETGGLRDIMFLVHQVSKTDAPVLILGETGSGKEVVARAIHERSSRRGGPVVRVNCGAIPPSSSTRNCSATNAVHLRVPLRHAKAGSNAPTVERCSSTKSVSCH